MRNDIGNCTIHGALNECEQDNLQQSFGFSAASVRVYQKQQFFICPESHITFASPDQPNRITYCKNLYILAIPSIGDLELGNLGTKVSFGPNFKLCGVR